ncbi:hypothetical protein TrispH2_001637 [Trichoplax sp. H2]|nr:hypothetical protein TrispH2_001637 [Trichoplax sp. H2]|eukprot:RDD46917.1 hypothetical protein TrispH2_001637 [Trichoplax sp. H2]
MAESNSLPSGGRRNNKKLSCIDHTYLQTSDNDTSHHRSYSFDENMNHPRESDVPERTYRSNTTASTRRERVKRQLREASEKVDNLERKYSHLHRRNDELAICTRQLDETYEAIEINQNKARANLEKLQRVTEKSGLFRSYNNSSNETENRSQRLRQQYTLDSCSNLGSMRSGGLYRTSSEMSIPRSQAHSPTASTISDMTTNAEEMTWEELTDELEFQKNRVAFYENNYRNEKMDRQRAMTDKEVFKFKLEKANSKIDDLKKKVENLDSELKNERDKNRLLRHKLLQLGIVDF